MPRPVIEVNRQSSVRLCCQAAGSPPPKIVWSGAQWTSNAVVMSQENGCLTINGAKPKPSESYICRATNSYGVAQTATTFITATANLAWCKINQEGMYSDGYLLLS